MVTTPVEGWRSGGRDCTMLRSWGVMPGTVDTVRTVLEESGLPRPGLVVRQSQVRGSLCSGYSCYH